MSFNEYVTVAPWAKKKTKTKVKQNRRNNNEKKNFFPINYYGHFATLYMLVSAFESSSSDIW